MSDHCGSCVVTGAGHTIVKLRNLLHFRAHVSGGKDKMGLSLMLAVISGVRCGTGP